MNQLNEWLILIILLVFFSSSDLNSRMVSNIIWIPIIAYALLNHKVLETSIFFVVSRLVGMNGFIIEKYGGGDAKLMTLTVAMISQAYLAIAASWIFLKLYRIVFKHRGGLPYAPFLLAGSVVIISLAYLCPGKI